MLDRKPVNIPIYDFKTHSREEKTKKINPADIILFEGIHALFDERLRDLMTYKIYVHCDDDIRLCRRMLRDI